MTRYSLIVFLHVLAAIIWVGGGVMLQVLELRARRAGPESVVSLGEAASWTSGRVFMPASFAALGTGIWAVLEGPWSFAEVWISIGFAGFIASAVLGMAILGPTSKAMLTLAADRGPGDPAVMRKARRLSKVGWIDLLILIAVVFVMVTKP
jgi:uncharacterized membrane protein